MASRIKNFHGFIVRNDSKLVSDPTALVLDINGHLEVDL